MNACHPYLVTITILGLWLPLFGCEWRRPAQRDLSPSPGDVIEPTIPSSLPPVSQHKVKEAKAEAEEAGHVDSPSSEMNTNSSSSPLQTALSIAVLNDSAPSDNLLQHAEFGQLTDWSCLGSCSIQQYSDQGRDVALVDRRTAVWNGLAQDVSSDIHQNGRYESSVWLRLPDHELGIAWMVLEVTTSTGTDYFGTVAVPLIGGEWQHLSQILNLTWSGILEKATWRIETEPATAKVLVDTPSLRELPIPIADNDIQSVQIWPDDPQQTITSIAGGNWRHDSADISVPLDSIGRYNLDNLDHRSARIVVDLAPWLLRPNGEFQDSGHIHNSFLLMQLMQEQNIERMVAIRDLPDWLMLNPQASRQRVVSPGSYHAVIDLLIDWLLYSQETYGLTISHLSFNEPDLGANIHWSPEAMADFIQQAGPRIATAGLDTKFLLGDCSSVQNCLHFSRTIWTTPSVHPYISSLAVHTWDRPQPPDLDYQALGYFAANSGLPLIVTEVGWDSNQWQQNPDTASFASWEHALQTAKIYLRVLKLTGATTTHFWQMLGTDYPTNNGSASYPVFHILQELSQTFAPGAQIVATSPNDSAIFSLAAVHQDKLVLCIINSDTHTRRLTITGLVDGTYKQSHIDENMHSQQQGPLSIFDSQVDLVLGGKSIHLLIQK